MKLGLNTLSTWLGVVMIILVISGAIAFATTDVMIDKLYGGKRTGFIIMLFAYAVYRGFRLYQNIKYKSRNEE